MTFVQAHTPPAPELLDGHKIITILSPKGGAGKTTTATNLAVGLARRHPRQVVLVDIDLQFGDVAGVLRLSPEATFSDVVRRWPMDAGTLKLQLAPHHSELFALCAPSNPAEADEITATHVEGVLSALSTCFRYVIVDTDPGLSERVLSALDVSTDVVMVCGTDVPSVRGLRKALDALDLIGMHEPTRHFALNRADAKTNLPTADIEASIGHTVDVTIPSSRDVVLATNEGVPIMESQSNPAIVASFERLCDRFEISAAGTGAERKGRTGLFRRKG